MSIGSVESAQRRRVDEDSAPLEAPKVDSPKTRSLGDDYERLSSPPATVPAAPAAKATMPTVASIAAKLKEVAATMNRAHVAECQKATQAEQRLMADLDEAKPKLEKTAKDLLALAKKAGPAAHDLYELAHGIMDVVGGIKHIKEGAVALETGLGEAMMVVGFLDCAKGCTDIEVAIRHLPHDLEKAKTAGPELDAVRRDLHDLGPTMSKLGHDAKEAAGLVTHYCVAG
jgi:hypothetical protein